MTQDQRDAAVVVMSNQLRKQLYIALTHYDYTITGFDGSNFPGVMLRVDQKTLFYLKKLPIVETITGDLPPSFINRLGE